MKLNNKGFAITAVLYGLLILFVFLVGSYMVALSVKKDRVEEVTSGIEEEYRESLNDPTLAAYIKKLYNTAPKMEVVNNSIIYNYAPSVSLMDDRLGGTLSSLDGGNIRYYGADPNNYIYFNCSDYANQSSSTCELWRIIGVFDGRVKIIRNDILGRYPWDYTSSGTYDSIWENSTVKQIIEAYFNMGVGYYYSDDSNGIDKISSVTGSVDFSSTGINIATRDLVDEVIWRLGGYDNSVVYPNQIYEFERGTTAYTGHPVVWSGKIGLMYPSDYGYATDFTECSATIDSYNTSGCYDNDWIYNSNYYQWTITPYYTRSYFVKRIMNEGYVDKGNAVYRSNDVRPVLYLKSNVDKQPIGTGTSSNPYMLSFGY